MAERFATFRPHVGAKSVPQELGAGSNLHGCEPNCLAFLLYIFKFLFVRSSLADGFDGAEACRQPQFEGFTVLSKEEH